MVEWNQPPQGVVDRPRVPQSSVPPLKKFAGYGVGLLFVILLNYYRSLLPVWTYLHQFSSGVALYGLITVLFLGLIGTGVQALLPKQMLQRWEQRFGGKEGMTSRQRALFGLPTPAPASAPPAAANAAGTPRFLGPPERGRKPVTPVDSRLPDSGRLSLTPTSEGTRRRTASPYNISSAVTTPEQLQQYLNVFDDLAGASRETSPVAGAGLYGDRLAAGQPFGGGVGEEEVVQRYRPSLQARGKTGSPLRADSVLSPSNQETFEAVLARLQTDARTLEVWIDRFREWLAARVFQPLQRSVASAHLEVGRTASSLGWRVEVSSLGQPGATNGNRGLQADEEAQINQVRAQLTAQLANPMQDQQRAAVLACLQAVRKYQGLSLLLRGEAPGNLLPPVPEGYIAARVDSLAQGSCLGQFIWNLGGSWQGKPWTPDLLTDSALVFYLFACYLQAPEWHFPLEERPATPATAPLYVGSLPSRPATHCTALLPVRPAALPSRATAVLALGLATREPSFTLVMQGQPALTLSSYTAVFIHLLLLVRCNQLHNFSALGNHSLDFLRLAEVVKPAGGRLGLMAGKWLALW